MTYPEEMPQMPLNPNYSFMAKLKTQGFSCKAEEEQISKLSLKIKFKQDLINIFRCKVGKS